MKNISKISLLVISGFIFSSCLSEKVVLNRQVETNKYGTMLLGRQSLDQFHKEPFSNWYIKEYDEYQVDMPTLQQLKKEKLNSYKITVFLGTWCEDSHREFPRLIKILDNLKYPKDKLEIIALNRKRESPMGEDAMENIQRVPTIIVRKYGKVVGRIVEMPQTGYIEKDLLEIIKK